MIRADTLRVIPNGVDTGAFKPDPLRRNALRRELGVMEGFLWMAAGRLEEVKDYPTLLRAMTGLPQHARLVIAGAGTQEAELRRQCVALGIEGRVRFVGFVAEINRWMQAADGYVLSSRWEGLPVALMEAAACALPGVATDVPGTREVILPGQSGYLVEQAQPAQLARSMLAVMHASPMERQAMGARARGIILERYSMEIVLSQWEVLYAKLMEDTVKHRSGSKVDCVDA